MNKIFLLIIAVLSIQSVAGNDGSGVPGGGIVRNGEYLTIGSAGNLIKLEVDTTVSLLEPQGLKTVYEQLNRLDLTPYMKSELIKVIDPTLSRQYFLIKQISQENMRKLKDQYKKFLKLDPIKDQMVIYAFTNPERGETYLLPDFKNLKDDIARAAILLHESLIILNSKLAMTKLKEIVEVQVAFESFARCQENCMATEVVLMRELSDVWELVEFKRQVKNYIVYNAALNDLKNGALSGFMDEKGNIEVASLFPTDSHVEYEIMKTRTHNGELYSQFVVDKENPHSKYLLILFNLKKKYPNSELIKYLYLYPYGVGGWQGCWSYDDFGNSHFIPGKGAVVNFTELPIGADNWLYHMQTASFEKTHCTVEFL